MGIERFLVANAVRAFIAQRLVRMLCSHCKRPAQHLNPTSNKSDSRWSMLPKRWPPPVANIAAIPASEGRAAIFEICLVSPRLQDMITQGRPESVLRATALDEGMLPLRHYGWTKVIAGYHHCGRSGARDGRRP